jgi:cell fate (sporulation/competence/biofilm development) regulator YmcA (YheA/YmcA/DUF963 family)
VPAAYFDYVNREITQLGVVTNFTTSSEDVTMMFMDLESRLNIRLEEERRLTAMRAVADEIEDMLTLERELTDLRITIDSYRRRMTEIDHLATFATIRVAVREVGVIASASGFGSRIASAFSLSVDLTVVLFEAISIAVAYTIVPAVLIAVPTIIIYKIVKRKKRTAT